MKLWQIEPGGEGGCFLDKVRQHIGVTCRRHFVNRNPTLGKYTGMLVAKKGHPFAEVQAHREQQTIFLYFPVQKKPNSKDQAITWSGPCLGSKSLDSD